MTAEHESLTKKAIGGHYVRWALAASVIALIGFSAFIGSEYLRFQFTSEQLHRIQSLITIYEEQNSGRLPRELSDLLTTGYIEGSIRTLIHSGRVDYDAEQDVARRTYYYTLCLDGVKIESVMY